MTDNDELYEYLKAMRAFGWVRELRDAPRFARENQGIDARFLFLTLGYNFRPSEIQGAFGKHQIRKLDKFIERRRRNAEYWNRRLHSHRDLLILPQEQGSTKHVYFGYPLTIREQAPIRREDLVTHLEKNGIETRPIMAGNVAEQPAMKQIPHRVIGDLSNSRLIMKRSFFFGNHNGIGTAEREYVADKIIEFLNSTIRT